LTYTRRHELHWLDIPERIQFRTAVTVHRCLNGLAPAYLTELSTPIIQGRSSCRLRSSYRNRLAVPSVKLALWLSVVFCVWPYCLECSTWLPWKSHPFHWCFQTLF